MLTLPDGAIIAADPLTEPFDGFSPAQLLTRTDSMAGKYWRAWLP